MKKMIPIVLAALMLIFIFAACGGKGGSSEGTDTPSSTVSPREPLKTDEATDEPQTETEAESEAASETETATETEALTETEKTEETEAEAKTAAPPATEAATDRPVVTDLRAAAVECIGLPVGELYARIGYPRDSLYAPSCMGDGDDGALYYSGFTVVTYSENGVETVTDVY